MTPDEQVTVCKAIAAISCWGGPSGVSIIEQLDKTIPMEPTWSQVYAKHQEAGKREYVGTITSGQASILEGMGYTRCNGNQLHAPSRAGGGLFKYIVEGAL